MESRSACYKEVAAPTGLECPPPLASGGLRGCCFATNVRVEFSSGLLTIISPEKGGI